jgi:hypothetical protein
MHTVNGIIKGSLVVSSDACIHDTLQAAFQCVGRRVGAQAAKVSAVTTLHATMSVDSSAESLCWQGTTHRH